MSNTAQTSIDNPTINTAVLSLTATISTTFSSFSDVILIGIMDHGYHIANRIAANLKKKCNATIPVGKIDISFYLNATQKNHAYVNIDQPIIPCNFHNKHLILIQDILHEGHKARAALNILFDFPHPKTIELAALIDRGYRTMPIHATYTGHALPLKKDQSLQLRLIEIDGEDDILIAPHQQ